MKPGTSKPMREYPYPSPRLVSLIRTTHSGRGWFLTAEGYRVKKPFHTFTNAVTGPHTSVSMWRRLLLFIRRIIDRFLP